MTNRDKLVDILERYPAFFCDRCGEDDLSNEFGRFAAYLLANGVAVRQWRDAKTDPPPIGKDVLLRFANETMVVGGLREDGGWYVIVDAEWYTDCEAVPEKWKPLPDVSKEEPK